MSTSIFLNFIKLLKSSEQINNKIKRLPYNAYYLAAKYISGNYRFDRNGTIYYEDVVIDCDSFLGVVIHNKTIIQSTNDKIYNACCNILPVTSFYSFYAHCKTAHNFLEMEFKSYTYVLNINICYLCGRLSWWIWHRWNMFKRICCESRRCINVAGRVCLHCFENFNCSNSTQNDLDCVCKEKYVAREIESDLNLEKLISNIIALG